MLKKNKTSVVLLIVCFTLLLSNQSFSQQTWPEDPMLVVFSIGYPPFSWQDEMGQPKGILIDTLTEVLHQQLKIQVQFKTYPWKRAQQMVELGEADAFITVPTVERSRYTIILDPPILPTEFKIFVNASNPKVSAILKAQNLDNLRQIKNLSTGYLTGSGWHIENLQGFPNVVTAAKLSEILKMVDAQRIDVYIDSALVVDYHLHKYDLMKKIISVGNVMDAPTWNLCIGKKSKYIQYVKVIEDKIQQMTQNGQLSRLAKIITSQ